MCPLWSYEAEPNGWVRSEKSDDEPEDADGFCCCGQGAGRFHSRCCFNWFVASFGYDQDAVPRYCFPYDFPLDFLVFAGILNIVILLCMTSKVNENHKKNPVGETFRSLKRIYVKEGVKGLYRGLSANMAGACSSWGLYFLWYLLFHVQ